MSINKLAEIKLTPLKIKDTERLLHFEITNRVWFEQFIPPREDGFYSLEGVKLHIHEFLFEYKCYRLWPLLITNTNREIIGRLNFTNINIAKGTAHVGYRIGENFVSKGMATAALAKGINLLRRLGMRRLFAYVELSNIASQKVLTANGFIKVRVVEGYVKLHGRPIDCIEFTFQINKNIKER